ncbi:glycoside hydrolase family 65 protein [Ruminococcus sp. 5_1_39BFAA]|uniref:glycoside hydrolase family 65 protein n=1 Tax=Ruminococcus sp. 5_1_39BFAA TaxID=457412 RepID=UPI003567D75F
MDLNKKPIYPIEPWTITEKEFRIENNYRNETTFALSNGYIGSRGTFEEAYPFDSDTGLEGNFINGFYESEQIRYGEANFGSPFLSQSLLNLPNLKETKLFLEGEEFGMRTGKTEEYARTLHMGEGILTRSLIWTSPLGKRVRIEIKRLVSFAHKNIMAIQYQVTLLNFSGKVEWCSKLQANVENHTRKTNPIVDYGPFGRKLEPDKLYGKGNLLYYEGTTQTSKLTVGCGSIHRVTKTGDTSGVSKGKAGAKAGQHLSDRTSGDKGEVYESSAVIGEVYKSSTVIGELEASLRLQAAVCEGETVTLEKFICYTSCLDMETEKLEAFTLEKLHEAEKLGFAAFEESQKAYMQQFWNRADVKIAGDDALQQGMRFNLFHVMQSAGRDGRTGMGAKGLSGEGYEGHYFWDTEMYVMPVLIYTEPETARALLQYRYSTLDQARARARILGHEKGALYPWRTINGEEASTYYPLGTAQYHINADIAYALSLYLKVTGDKTFFKEMGAEMLIETARIWADVGSFAECKGGKYCICDVTGPDEYNVLVDNNFYTNLMAKEHLRDAAEAVEYLQKEAPECLEKISRKIGFDTDEAALWKKIIENMYFPYDEKRQVYPMDDGFMMRKPWDESKIPVEKRAWLYENYHPLFIMRHRMSKQADAILGMYLHSGLFTEEELRRNYDFYQEVTLHHSSLSTCIFGIVACRIGYYEEAFRYFSQSARMDLDDYHNNFYAGIHAANMAGTWQAMVNGFAGLRLANGIPEFSPYLPEEWEGYSFKLLFRGKLLKAEIKSGEAIFTLEEGEEITFKVREKVITIKEQGGYHIEKI